VANLPNTSTVPFMPLHFLLKEIDLLNKFLLTCFIDFLQKKTTNFRKEKWVGGAGSRFSTWRDVVPELSF